MKIFSLKNKYAPLLYLGICLLAILLVYSVYNSRPDSAATLKSSGSAAPEPAAPKKIVAAVSIVPEEAFVKAVGQDLVETVVLIPPGSSESNYAPSPQVLTKLSEAALYFPIGVPAEAANILPRLPDINKNLRMVDLAAEAAKVYPEREYEPGARDPHIWLSPKRAITMIEAISRALSENDPEQREQYAKNAKDYIEKLEAVDRAIAARFSKLERKTFLVYHPAFGYFADDYGLTMLAVESEGKEAGIDDLRDVINRAKQEKIKTIFYQEEVDSKQARVIAEELGGQMQLVAPLAANYLENLETMAELITNSLTTG